MGEKFGCVVHPGLQKCDYSHVKSYNHAIDKAYKHVNETNNMFLFEFTFSVSDQNLSHYLWMLCVFFFEFLLVLEGDPLSVLDNAQLLAGPRLP